MRLCFLYTPWCLMLITLFSEISEQAKYLSVIDFSPNHIQRDEGNRP